MDPLSNLDVLERILMSLAVGTIIGIEREWSDKPAGVRTYALVCEGSALFMVTSLLLGEQVAAANGGNYDPSRIASTVVQGIGFLGGGVIFMRGRQVQGITTASAIWVTAALGLMIGAGFYVPAVIGVLCSVFVLVPMRWFEREMMHNDRRERTGSRNAHEEEGLLDDEADHPSDEASRS